MRGTFAVYVEPGIVLTPELIRNRRKELNLTQAKFSARVGVSVETDSRWERGRLVPKKKNRLKIVEVLRLKELTGSITQAGETQKGGQLTEQGTGPAEDAGADSSGKAEDHRTVPDCRSLFYPAFSEAFKLVVDAIIEDRVERYLAVREKEKNI